MIILKINFKKIKKYFNIFINNKILKKKTIQAQHNKPKITVVDFPRRTMPANQFLWATREAQSQKTRHTIEISFANRETLLGKKKRLGI